MTVRVQYQLKTRYERLRERGMLTLEEMAQRLTQNQGCKITRTALSRQFRDQGVSLAPSMIEARCSRSRLRRSDDCHQSSTAPSVR